MRDPTRKRRPFPYYKVQVFDARFQVWKDERKVFDTAAEARRHIEESVAPRPARIMVVERDSRHVLEQ
ncbi:MAG TPA: hypothetical protein VG148_00450 [Pyrinomonadaceae bacterium]|nr:hypothetical protein [Pyrinomonadaceae bacterium]